jgi:hypothetical protein
VSHKTNTGLKGPRLFFIILGILIIFGLTSYLAFNQFILKPIAAEEERAYQLSRENRKLSKEYEDRQSILIQLVNAKRARLLAMNTLEAVAGNIPDGVTLEALSFNETRNSQGNNIILRGRVSQEDLSKLNDYTGSLAKAKNAQSANQPLFSEVMPPNMDARAGGYLNWYIICTIKMEELNTVDASNPILPEAPQPVNYKWEIEEQSPLKIFLDGKKRLKSVAAKLQKEKKAYNQIFASIQTIEAGGKSIPSGFLPFARDARQAQKLMLEGIQSEARRAGLNFTRSRGVQSGSRRTDQVFDEHRRTVSFQCNPKDLVNFIRSINQEMVAVRVRDLRIMPTADRKQLKVDLTLSVHILKPNARVNGFEADAIGQLLFGMNNNEEQNKAIHQYLDNASQTFAKSDAFRLIPPPKVEKPPEIEEFVPVGAPQLAGLLRINGRTKAILRISPPRGKKAQYYELAVGEDQDGVKVISVDVTASTVVVKIGETTYDLKIGKQNSASEK